MRTVCGFVAVAAFGAAAAAWPASPAGAACSVFSRHPCHPTFCSVFQRRPCIPEIEYPIGQDLRLTIESASTEHRPKASGGNEPKAVAATAGGDEPLPNSATHEVNTILQLYGALRECWVPPALDEARPGTQMSVRFSFKRTGEIIATPRVTYTTPGTPPAIKETYRNAITQALQRCTPMPFTTGLGGAVAGRPINIRYVDNRKPQ